MLGLNIGSALRCLINDSSSAVGVADVTGKSVADAPGATICELNVTVSCGTAVAVCAGWFKNQ